MTARAALIVAALAAIVATATLTMLRLGAAASSGPPDPASMIWVLFAAAALCIAGLSYRRAPSMAWIAIVVALTIATLDIAAFGREHRSAMSPEAWHWLVAVTCLGALAATFAAAAYALEPGRRFAGWVGPVAAIVVAIVALACIWAIATADPSPPVEPASPLGTLSVATRTLIVAVAVLLGLGILGDLRPAFRRTRVRLGVGGASMGEAIRVFVDDQPGQARARRAATAERSRIAVELHADVVPAVRRALAEAERGGSADQLAAALRDVLGELDDLAADRRSVVLEELGLLAAVEQLAERTEERSDVRVTIEIPDAGATARPPREVEAAASGRPAGARECHPPSRPPRSSSNWSPRRLRSRWPSPTMGPDWARTASRTRSAIAVSPTCGPKLRTAAPTLTTGARIDGRGTVIRFAWTAA